MTLIEATPNRITQIKTAETDGYSAVQVTVGVRRAAFINKPQAGHLAKAKVEAGRGLWELRVEDDQIRRFRSRRRDQGRHLRQSASWSTSRTSPRARASRARSSAGTSRMGDATHGNSLSHRSPGSIGQRQTPGRVFPGKKMAGHMGAVQQSTQNLKWSRSTPSAA